MLLGKVTPQPSDDIRQSKVKLLTKKFDLKSNGSSSVKNTEEEKS